MSKWVTTKTVYSDWNALKKAITKSGLTFRERENSLTISKGQFPTWMYRDIIFNKKDNKITMQKDETNHKQNLEKLDEITCNYNRIKLDEFVLDGGFTVDYETVKPTGEVHIMLRRETYV